MSLYLSLQTALLSVSVGTTCTFYEPMIVLEALALTAAIVVALTVYTFNAARKGANFRCAHTQPPVYLPVSTQFCVVKGLLVGHSILLPHIWSL